MRMVGPKHLILELPGHTDAAVPEFSTDVINLLPQCAATCLAQKLPSINCSTTDVKCICTHSQFWSDVSQCSHVTCTTREILTTLKDTKDLCGVPDRDISKILVIGPPILAGLPLIMVLLRLYTRFKGWSGAIGADDVLITFAWVCAFPAVILLVFLQKAGVGRDVWNVSFDHITDTLRYLYALEISYQFATIITRISILAFYLRIFPHERLRKVVYGMIGINIAFLIAFVIVMIFQCTPVSYAWWRWDSEHKGKCINVNAAAWANAAITMAFDAIVLIIPLPALYKLQRHYTFWRKVQIFFMFSFGLIVTTVSALRLRSLVRFANSNNPTWDYFDAILWSGIEIYTGIACACLPAMKSFFQQMMPKVGISKNEKSFSTDYTLSAGSSCLDKKRRIARTETCYFHQAHHRASETGTIEGGLGTEVCRCETKQTVRAVNDSSSSNINEGELDGNTSNNQVWWTKDCPSD